MARVAFFGVKTKLVIDTFTVAPKATPWRASTRSKESNVDLRTMRIKRSFLCRLANRTGRVLRTKLVWGLSSPDRVLAPRKEARAIGPGLCEAAGLRLRGDRDGPGYRPVARRHGDGGAEPGNERV